MKTLRLILLSLLFTTQITAQKQILIASNGVNATFTVEKYKHENKEITYILSVKWVDEDLNPVDDQNSQLVLLKSKIKATANQPLTIKEFKNTDNISFHKDFVLHIKYMDEDIKNINISIEPYYKATVNSKPEKFEMAYPEKYQIHYDRIIEPKIFVTEPATKKNTRGMKRLVENDNIRIVGYVKSDYPVIKFLINREEVQLLEGDKFEYPLKSLSKGENKIKIKAIDNQGNSKTLSLIIDYRPPLTEQDLNEINYYALIIANDKYNDPMISSLDHPIDDATNLYNVLTKKYDFEPEQIIFLKNASNKQIVKAFDSLANSITSYDNLLIFYAGHGYWDENTEIGYWLPADAQVSDKSTWFANSSLRDYIKAIKSNHTLLIADACFSGGIFKTRGAFDNASYAITKLYNMPSRKAMTSGTLKEVPDVSVFLKYLIKRLNENEKTYISAAELFNSFRNAVLNNSPNIPQYGVIRDSGDEGGDFIFIKKK